jgi:hypothetical protein
MIFIKTKSNNLPIKNLLFNYEAVRDQSICLMLFKVLTNSENVYKLIFSEYFKKLIYPNNMDAIHSHSGTLINEMISRDNRFLTIEEAEQAADTILKNHNHKLVLDENMKVFI